MTSRWRHVAMAVGVLLLAWLVTPRSAPPVYDGVGSPDEAYRFVDPPSGYPRTANPTEAVHEFPLTVGGDYVAASLELGPQVVVDLPTSVVVAPPGARLLKLTATPIHPVAAPNGVLWSNVYRVEATTPEGPVSLVSPGGSIELRAPTRQAGARLEVWREGTWTAVQAGRKGTDIWRGPLTVLGDYALVGVGPLDFSTVSSGDGVASRTGVIVGIVAVQIMVVVFFITERRSRRRRLAARAARAAS